MLVRGHDIRGENLILAQTIYPAGASLFDLGQVDATWPASGEKLAFGRTEHFFRGCDALEHRVNLPESAPLRSRAHCVLQFPFPGQWGELERIFRQEPRML